MARTPTTPSVPAEAPAEDDILIREIDEAVRQDDALEFLRNHGAKLLGAIIVLIGGLGGYLLWDHFRESELEGQSEALVSALDYAGQNDFKTADEKVAALLDDGSPGARTAARLLQAGAALQAGEVEKAAGLYQQVAADEQAPPALRDLARIREVAAQYDSMKPADVIAKIAPLAEPDSPWFGSAAELLAMAHLENGNKAEAGKLFAQIAKDEEQPETLRSRARQMAGLLGVDAIVDVEKLLEAEGVASGGNGGAAVTE
ncbi:tetratricopeptide repeat protein [Erythrobacter sp. sf7]|uniref:Tetratricopeptide repeat protein n=1 Tax=Erythrobacter fulvus TaxID=2987523 RepID=A0ABT5JQH5_9SPHN|nr:tetratricopeptide repeat protein [Erythrobacter fulvus]MDC8755030.1 tetratricopeptide repeat protein [Erythrobacter fulvus]